MKLATKILTFFILITLHISCVEKQKTPLKLPKLFSNHMVLQQQEDVTIWGTYTAGEKLTFSTSWGTKNSTNSDKDGHWQLKIATPKAGGPYNLKIKTKDSILEISDIMIGEVWLASGQSNMEMPLKGRPPRDSILHSKKEIKEANYPNIRMFTVERNLSPTPLDSINGKWLSANSETVGNFSATAYFFAKKLYKELNVPIGIIHSSWGGTPAEGWTSQKSLKDLKDFDKTLDDIQNISKNKILVDNWIKKWPKQNIPLTKEGWENITFNDEKALKTNFDDSNWDTINLPNRFDLKNNTDINGTFLFRKQFLVEDVSSDYRLKIKAIDDMDAIFINGKKVGGLMGLGFWSTPREITISKTLLVKGKNTIAMRVIDMSGHGVVKGPMTLSNSNGSEISIEGNWKYRLVAEIYNQKFYTYGLKSNIVNPPKNTVLNAQMPSLLFNAMIKPLVPYKIKGAIWYQGESNVGRDEQYKRLFPKMIEDWRTQWNEDFPFYFVQIAPYNYGERASQKLRDAQRLALKTPKTGMAITLDIGNATNIHPPNKLDVGNRLALLALKNDYGKNLVSSGPLYKNIQKSDTKLIVTFDFIGSGLVAKDDKLTEFEIAGANKIYKPAIAKIVNNKVEVSHPTISNPEYVRYAWKNTSTASLFNKEGLPASSFTSED